MGKDIIKKVSYQIYGCIECYWFLKKNLENKCSKPGKTFAKTVEHPASLPDWCPLEDAE